MALVLDFDTLPRDHAIRKLLAFFRIISTAYASLGLEALMDFQRFDFTSPRHISTDAYETILSGHSFATLSVLQPFFLSDP